MANCPNPSLKPQPIPNQNPKGQLGLRLTMISKIWDTVTGMKLSPDGGHVLTNSMDNTVRMWVSVDRTFMMCLLQDVRPCVNFKYRYFSVRKADCYITILASFFTFDGHCLPHLGFFPYPTYNLGSDQQSQFSLLRDQYTHVLKTGQYLS